MRLFARPQPRAQMRLAGQPRDTARPLAVMHIPKTSGMALIGGLTAALRPRQLLSGFDLCLFGGFDRFDTIAPDVRSHIHVTPAQVPQGADVIAAHMACSTLQAAYPAAQMMTFLREPRCRLLSHYVYWRAQTPDALSPWGAWAQVSLSARERLEVFLQRAGIAAQTDNLSLRMLLWPHPAIPRDGFIAERDDATLVEQALARLDGFSFLEIIERPGLTEALSAWCGAAVTYAVVNETPHVPDAARTLLEQEFTPAAFDALHRRTRLDAALWTALAARHMAEPAAAQLAAAAFARGVARFARLLAP